MRHPRITVELAPVANDARVVTSGLSQFNAAVPTGRPWGVIQVYLRDEDGAVQGGVLAEHYRGSLQINIVWVSEAFRRRGYGTAMLDVAEGEAVKHGCSFAHLDTFSFQAPAFYQRLGYAAFARLDGYADGESRYYLRKTLASPAVGGMLR